MMAPGQSEQFNDNVPRRVQELERHASNQGTTIATLVTAQADFLKRLERLEALAQMRAITEAREDERDKALYNRLDRMEDQIQAVKSDLQKQIEETKKDLMSFKGLGVKALWVFVSAFIVAFAAWIIKGGLK